MKEEKGNYTITIRNQKTGESIQTTFEVTQDEIDEDNRFWDKAERAFSKNMWV